MRTIRKITGILCTLLFVLYSVQPIYGYGGNCVRAVLNEQGELTQATDYSAYGVPSTRYAGTATNNHLHLGLEWQPMKGVQ